MATVKIDRFGGIAPSLHPTLLPDGFAVVAHNCRLESGKLKPIMEPLFVDAETHTVYHEDGLGSITDAHSLYCWKHTLKDGTVRTDFLAFPGRVYFAHGNIADDERDRVFVTGETGVSFTSSNGVVTEDCPAAYMFDRESGEIERHCLCKEALDALRCSVSVQPTDVSKMRSTYFFVSWYDKYGYESPSSAQSRNRNYTSDGTASYSGEPLDYETGGLVNFSPLHLPKEAYGFRIYMANRGGDETESIQFVAEFGSDRLTAAEFGFSLRIDENLLGETMPEIEAPPMDLLDMVAVPGGFYAARCRSMPHTVLFSEVGNPTSWPVAYRYDVRDNVVKLAVTSNSVFALTDGTPFVLTGTAPESMTVASLANAAACVSEKSVVVTENMVHFASNNGLYRIANAADAGTLCLNITEGAITKEQWQSLKPETCIAGVHDGTLHLFFAPGEATFAGEGESVALALKISGGDGIAQITTHDEVALCTCVDDTTDDMYFVRSNDEE